MIRRLITRRSALAILALAALVSLASVSFAQDRLKTYPGYDRVQTMSKELQGAFKTGALTVRWADDGKSFEYTRDGRTYKYDIAKKQAVDTGAAQPAQKPEGMRGGRGGGPARGRQFTEAVSPDKKIKAFYRDRNLWLSDSDGKNEIQVTTDGDAKTRVKYATGSWVYGEELGQTTAMWWSPDSKRIAYYRFDESKVPDYFLQMDQTKVYSQPDIEAYPKAGQPNPIVDILVYDVASKTSVKVDVRDGKPFEDAVVGHYVFRVSWTADGTELLFYRTNRRQNILDVVAANPATGKCRVIIREEWPTGWVEDYPPPSLTWLKDNKRFLWVSERSGFRNFYLYDLTGKLLATVTNHPFEVANIVKVDETGRFLYYMARDGANFKMLQLHRVGLDGKDGVRLTDPAFNHGVSLSPDAKYFTDVYQTHDTPPATRLIDVKGKVVAHLAKSDLTKFEQLGLKKTEVFTFKAADGVTDLFGSLQFPSNFDPNKKYPVLVSVYGGPGWNGTSENFGLPSLLTEYGFLIASFDFRGSSGRGKKAMDSIYLKLGIVEIDDQAAGVKSLWSRPYVNKDRVGIYGTSYGGYASDMCLLRYPDVFAAACGSSAVTSWYQYDSIYTERYMWIPQENKEGYEAGSAMTYAKNLKGRLMIYYGTADNNVHPTNAMQLIQALQPEGPPRGGAGPRREGKSFEVQVGPDQGHSGINQDRMMEFFIENLVLR